MKRFLIIPSAGLATRLSPLNNYYCKALLPVGDEPILARILAMYDQVQIDKVIVVVNRADLLRFETIQKTYEKRYQIVLVVQDEPKGLLPAIFAASDEFLQADEVCVHLSDTLLTKPFKEKDFKQSFVLVASVSDCRPWAMVSTNGHDELVDIVNKPETSVSTQAIIGVYFFKHAKAFQQVLTSSQDEAELSVAILAYNKVDSIQVKMRSDWQDIGDIRNLHHAREAFSTYKKAEVYRQSNSVIKKTTSADIEREQYFYRHVRNPEVFPRLLGSTPHKLKLSFVPLRSLAYYALYENVNSHVVGHIFTSLHELLHESFYEKTVHWSEARVQTEWMYGQRIVETVYKDMEEWADVKYWSINGKKVLGFCELREVILVKAKELARTAVIRHIHGDLHFANILYDPLSNTFTFLDPRGVWGTQYSIYGDVRYDVAKLLHSFHGGYEYIKRQLSVFEELGHNSYSIQYPEDSWASIDHVSPLLQKYKIELSDVLWIEALCFLSMGRCYPDLLLKKQFFLQGVYLINQLL